MSVSLATLTARLTAAVPARNGTPSTAQYGQCVEDAVADLSLRKPNQKMTTLNIADGTAAYALPADFVRLILLAALGTPIEGVIITGAGLIPVDADWDETYTIAGLTLTFTPTPAYSTTRKLWYAAGHALDSNAAYPDLMGAEAALALLKAQALALDLQANAAAQESWSYSIGDESVNKAALVKGLADQAKRLDEKYEAAVKKAAGGAWGMRG